MIVKACSLWITAYCWCLVALGQTNTPPNIFLIMADDMNWRDCGAYAGMPGAYAPGEMPGSLTPNMDSLADEGMRFNACFSATAMCAPLRQQLYTGIYPVRSGAYPNHGEVKPGTQSIVHHLTARGYRVGLMGKTHFGPTASFPFEILGSGTETEDPANIDAAEEFINRNPSQPYCLVVTSHNPHVPWNHGNYVADNTTLPIAADCVDTPEYRTSFNSYLGEVKAFDDEVGLWMDKIAESPDPSNTIVICLTEQGAQLPGAKWTCYDAGIRAGCLIRWPAHIVPGSESDALIEYGDFVPTLIEAAGGKVPTGLHRLDGLSFLPVLLGEKASHRPYVHSVQTTKEVIGQPDEGYAVRSIRDERYKLIWNLQYDEVFYPGAAHNALFYSWVDVADDTGEDPAVRAHAQQMIDRYINRPEWQFFDLETDPYEFDNLIDEPAHAIRIAGMKELLSQWMLQQRDRGIATEQAADASTLPVYDEVDPYHAWAGQYAFLWLTDQAPDADPDGDLRGNFAEWIEGTHPLVSDTPAQSLLAGIQIDGSGQQVDLQIHRPRNFAALDLTNIIVSTHSLGGGWASNEVAQVGWPDYPGDEAVETATLRAASGMVSTGEFYRVATVPVSAIPAGPEVYFSGSTTPVNIGGNQGLLNNKSISITVQATLPDAPLTNGVNDRAEVLWELGAGNGISLVLMGDQIVFSGATSSLDSDWINLSSTLDPGDFGKPITIRFSLEHEASSTIFQLSRVVEDGSSSASASEIRQNTGYIGTDGGGFGDYYGGSGGKLPGVSGTPYGILATLPGGLADVSAWSSGNITYELAGYVAPAF